MEFLTGAEGTVCAFADAFFGTRTLKRFSCETSGRVSINQVELLGIKLVSAIVPSKVAFDVK